MYSWSERGRRIVCAAQAAGKGFQAKVLEAAGGVGGTGIGIASRGALRCAESGVLLHFDELAARRVAVGASACHSAGDSALSEFIADRLDLEKDIGSMAGSSGDIRGKSHRGVSRLRMVNASSPPT